MYRKQFEQSVTRFKSNWNVWQELKKKILKDFQTNITEVKIKIAET